MGSALRSRAHDIEARAGQVARGKGGVERLLIDERLASRVQKIGARLHGRELRVAEEVLGLSGGPDMQRDEIRSREQVGQGWDLLCRRQLAELHIWVVDNHAHSERNRALTHAAADVAKA